ncbi:MAG TPA: DUF2066 domain-containing protein [Stellaceae bacterium]|nr:DUF2066 domain-containing protein [Stellaceae bacterium]
MAGLAVAALLLFAAAATPCRAEDKAASDRFAATVPVDATASSVVNAREMARLAGQRRALDAVVARLGGAAAPAKLPPLSDQAVTDLVASFAVANERMSPVRYQADYTFHFRPDAVRDLISRAGIALVPANGTAAAGTAPSGTPPPAGKPVVVLPVYAAGGQTLLWEDPNPWRDAWNEQPAAAGPVTLIVPLGDAGDVATIDAGRARAGDAQALTAEARANGGDEALVALAAPQGPAAAPSGLAVTVRDYRSGQLIATHDETLTASAGESADALFSRAAAAVAAGVEGGWKQASPATAAAAPAGSPAASDAAASGPRGTLTAVLPIDSLDDWVHVRAHLVGVPQIKQLTLIALSRQQATVEIEYAGNLDQLKTGLAQISLGLVQGDKRWRLARNAPGQTQ